jgi:hypothetical protein
VPKVYINSMGQAKEARSQDQMTTDVDDFFNTTGGKSAAFHEIGATVTGIVVASERREQTEFGTGEIKRFDDGNPMMQVVITLQTEERADADDDGARMLYVKGSPNTEGSMAYAIREALAGQPMRNGSKLQVKYTGDGVPSRKGWNAPKLYTARFKLGEEAVAEDAALNDDQAPPWQGGSAQPVATSTGTGTVGDDETAWAPF